MASSTTRLSKLQHEVLDAFFARESDFFLTGGAALVGFYFGHRVTDDLDLFTLEAESFERGRFILRETASDLGAELHSRLQAPGFQRFVLSRGDEGVVVDLILERVPQVVAHKPVIQGIRIDPLQEIFANKLTAIASRGEIRDLVDVMRLEREGLDLDNALENAFRKDGGCTPATLAWVLSEIGIPAAFEPPGEVSGEDLRDYLAALIRRLRARSHSSIQRPASDPAFRD